MKLLYVIHQYFPDCFSGTEQYCLATAREGRRQGDEVVVLSLEPWPDGDNPPLVVGDRPYDGFTVLRLRHWRALQPNAHLRDYQNPLAAALFRNILRDVKPDAVHFFHLRNLGADLIPVAKDEGCRVIVTLTDFWFLCPRFTLLHANGSLCDGPPDGGIGCLTCMEPELRAAWHDAEVAAAARQFANALAAPLTDDSEAARVAALVRRKPTLLAYLQLADAVFAPSRFLAAMFERNGFAAERITVVPYGLEPDRIRPVPVERPRQPLRIGFVGVLSPWKAAHVVIDAVRQVVGAVHLTIHGRLDEGMFRDYIAGLRARADGDPRINFAGAFDRDGASAVFEAMDLLVVPSTWYENTPFVMLEAMEAGVPVACSALGGMAELITDGVNGLTFPAGDAKALAAVLQRCLAEPTLLARLAPKPPPRIADNYAVFRRAYDRVRA